MDYKAYEKGQQGNSFWDIADNELKQILLKYLKKKELFILNVGCGTGEDTKLIREYGSVYLLDIDKKALELIPNKFSNLKIIANAEKIPCSAEYFDVVCMFGSIEHIQNDKKVIEEVTRVLKKGGLLLMTGPAYQWLYSSHDQALDHIKRYTKKDIQELTKSWFREVHFSYWNTILFIPVAILKMKDKNKEPKLHNVQLPVFVDKIILSILRLDNKAAKYKMHIPFGANFYAVYEKK